MLKFTHWSNDPGTFSVGLSHGAKTEIALLDFEVVNECVGSGYCVARRGVYEVFCFKAYGASLLHALELGIVATARWIAVELLKDPAPPTEGERVEGVALWLALRAEEHHELFLMSQRAAQGTMGVFSASPVFCSVYGLIDMLPLTGPVVNCVSREGAVAVIVEHAAPWIAAALEKEIKP